MVLGNESFRHNRVQSRNAAGYFEDPAAMAAEKVVVVRLPRKLVPADLAGNLNGHQFAIAQPVAQVAVDGGNANLRSGLPRPCEYLRNR